MVHLGFNWVGLAEGAATIANNERYEGGPTSIDWARIAVIIYESLIQSDPWLAPVRHSMSISMMNLRVGMIRHFGAVPGDKVLDVDSIVQWFYSELKLSYDEAAKLTESGPNFSDADWLPLRELRYRIEIIKRLHDSGALNLSDDLKRWIALWPKLS